MAASALVPFKPPPWADSGDDEIRAGAARDGVRLLRPIAAETALERFIDHDPCALESDLHGNGRFGWIQHLFRAGMFDGTGGRDGDVRGVPLTMIRADNRARERVAGTVAWPHGGHRLVVGPTGAMKSTAALLPMLLNDDGANCFIIDPADGELAAASAVYRALVLEGPACVAIIDPCGLTPSSASLNPLDVIHSGNPGMVRDARKLVDAVVLSSGQERDPFWVAKAKDVLLAILLHLCTAPRSIARSGRVATFMDAQEVLAMNFSGPVLEEMAANDAAAGLIRRAAVEISDLKTNAPSTWHGVKVQIDASLGFLNDPGVRATLQATSFPVEQLRTGRLSVYVVLEKKEMASLARWLRLLYASVLDRVYNSLGKRPLHVVVDEFPALGRFERVETDLATLKKFGVSFHLAAQDYNQLHQLYGHGWQSIVGNCGLRQFMGVNDNFTADYVSHALGQTTKRDGFDTLKEHEDGPLLKRWRWVGAPLLAPAEVLRLPHEQMILITDRTRPFRLPKTPFFLTHPWAARAGLSLADRWAIKAWRARL